MLKPPARQWFRDEDGTYYRNCPLIAAERDEVRAWPAGAFLKWALAEELSDEWWRTFRDGAQRKAALDPGDVVATPGSFREAYPRNPGLWVLDETGRLGAQEPGVFRVQLQPAGRVLAHPVQDEDGEV